MQPMPQLLRLGLRRALGCSRAGPPIHSTCVLATHVPKSSTGHCDTCKRMDDGRCMGPSMIRAVADVFLQRSPHQKANRPKALNGHRRFTGQNAE